MELEWVLQMTCCIIGCGHCKTMKPEYAKAAAALKEKNVRDVFNNWICIKDKWIRLQNFHVKITVMCDWLNYSDLQIDGVLAAVDATKEKKIGDQFKITGFPTVKYFKYVAFKGC